MKHFLFILLAAALAMPCFAGAAGEPDEPDPIEIIEIKRPEGIVPESNDRPIASGYVDNMSNEINLSFATNVGKVAVSVSDMTGQTVARRVCDTSMQSEFTLPVTADTGIYTIDIANHSYEATGRFDVMKAW